MKILSSRITDVPGGVALRTAIDGEIIRAYVVISPPDLEAIATIVPREDVDAGGDIHATAVEDAESAETRVRDVLENMNPGDMVVLLCADAAAQAAAMELLGYDGGDAIADLH